MELDAKSPGGPIETQWDRHRFNLKLVNPANKRKYTVIVVGTGLAGGSAAASLAELGYQVKCFCFQDSPRRAHSIAAQGGINAAKNYHNDGDSVYRLFYDTVKGGDFRAREANVYRLAQLSLNIIDQCVGQGVPFAREYSGYLDNRSFGGAQVSRTFYARGQTGQQLLLGAYQALERQIGTGQVEMHPRTEMLDLIVVDGRARGITTRDLITGQIESHLGDAVVLGTGGYGNVYYLSTNAKGSNATAIWRAHAAVGAIEAAIQEDHAAVVVLHLPGGIDFLGLDAAVRILAQLHQPTARTVGRGGKHHAVVVERRGTVDAHAVGGPVIPPEELTVGRRDSDECSGGRIARTGAARRSRWRWPRRRPLQNLRNPPKPPRPPGPRPAPPGATGTSDRGRQPGPAGLPPLLAGHLALPDRLASQLVEGHQHGVRGARGDR